RQVFDCVVPPRTGNRISLRLAKHRAGFDKVHIAREPGRAEHAQRIRRQRAPPRTEFRIDCVRRRAGPLPCVGKRGADHLAEHLADLRRRGEIAVGSEGIAGCIIISVARFHEGFDADRPLGLDAFAKRPLERSHAAEAVPATGSTRTRRFLAVNIRYAPSTISGIESHWPMCRPVTCEKRVSWLSGSRMNSTPKRKIP